MKKILFALLTILSIGFLSGCIKSLPYTTTPITNMHATINTYTFNTTTVYPSTLTSVNYDSTYTLYITGEDLVTRDKIVLTIFHYKEITKVYSVSAGEAAVSFIHAQGTSIAQKNILNSGGLVAITKFTPDCIIGYFNFNTPAGVYTPDAYICTDGTFSVPKPFYVAHP